MPAECAARPGLEIGSMRWQGNRIRRMTTRPAVAVSSLLLCGLSAAWAIAPFTEEAASRGLLYLIQDRQPIIQRHG